MALRGLFGKGDKDVAPPATPLSGDDTTLAPSPAAASLADEKMPTTTSTAPDSRPQSHDGDVIAAQKDTKVDAAEKKEGEEEEEEDLTEYPKSMQLALISIALCLSVFCMALDNTIITTAIPRITDQFKAINDVGWYGSAYLLTTCAFQLFFGKLYTFFSIKWIYLSALVIFEIGSAVCGAAPNSTALIIGRAVAGLGSAGIFSGAILIVANTVPLRQRPTYMGLIGGTESQVSLAR
jgi:hypothetical protein